MMASNWIPEEEYQKMINVLTEVSQERKRQHAKFGQQNHNPALFATILNEEAGEVNKVVCEYTFAEGDRHWMLVGLREELIQLAAVAVQMVECLDRNELRK